MANSDQSLYSGQNQLRYNQVSNALEGTSGSPNWTPLALSISSDLLLANGKILVGDTGGFAAPVSVTGDISLSNAGVAAISSGVIVNADINASAAIVYSKLALTGSIVNADINASAAVALSKLEAVTASKVLVSDSSGFVSASSVTTTTLGYLDATSSIQTQLDTKVDTAGRGLTKTSTTLDVTPSTQTATASGGNVTPTSDTKDTVIVTVDADVTILAPSGTPVSGQKLLFRLDNDSSHAATFDTGGAGKFRFGATITSYIATASKSDYIGAIYNSLASRWDIVSTSLGF